MTGETKMAERVASLEAKVGGLRHETSAIQATLADLAKQLRLVNSTLNQIRGGLRTATFLVPALAGVATVISVVALLMGVSR